MPSKGDSLSLRHIQDGKMAEIQCSFVDMNKQRDYFLHDKYCMVHMAKTRKDFEEDVA